MTRTRGGYRPRVKEAPQTEAPELTAREAAIQNVQRGLTA